MKNCAFDNNILLFQLPAKCTHKLQPLDVAVFRPIQNAWQKRADVLAYNSKSCTQKTVISEYMGIRDQGMTAEVINRGWLRSGHVPFNPEIFGDEDYAPAKRTSTITHTPASYPDYYPSSPKLASSDDLTYREATTSEIDSEPEEGIGPAEVVDLEEEARDEAVDHHDAVADHVDVATSRPESAMSLRSDDDRSDGLSQSVYSAGDVQRRYYTRAQACHTPEATPTIHHTLQPAHLLILSLSPNSKHKSMPSRHHETFIWHRQTQATRTPL
jgi:hypothetical protein